MLRFLIVLAVTFASVQGKEVCYEPYGCYSTDSPWTNFWHRPIGALPDAPEEVGTRYLLYTRDGQYRDEPYELMEDKDFIFDFSPFAFERPIVIILHGFTHNYKMEWVQRAKENILNSEDVNLIVIDWENGSKGTMLQAAANARLNGDRIAYFLDWIDSKTDEDMIGSTRIIAQGVGVHCAAYVGQAFGGRLGRITGIDPSDAYFTGTDKIVRIDESDAQFVDIIHTNRDSLLGLGLGMPDAVGHVDFWPNGGRKQPGCKDTISGIFSSILDLIFFNFDGVIDTWSCSHVRGNEFWIESITSSCPYVAFKCKDYDEFDSGKCANSCGTPGSCTRMGWGADKFPEARGSFYLDTDSSPSYCYQQVMFNGVISADQEDSRAKLELSIPDASGAITSKIVIADTDLYGNTIYNQWFEVPSKLLDNPEDDTSIVLRYTRAGLFPSFQPEFFSFDEINLYVIDKDLKLQKKSFGPKVLEKSVDFILNPITKQ